MKNTTIVKNDGGKILYNGEKMELFIPDFYFKEKLAEQVGQSYNIFGNLIALHYSKIDDDRSKASKSTLLYPLTFMTTPSETSMESIDFGNGEQKYMVLTYYKDDVLFESNEIVRDSENVQNLFTLIVNGKLDMVEYDYIPKMLTLSKFYNGVNFGVPAMYEEVMISDYYRDPNDFSKPARFIASTLSDKHSFYARGITQREKASFTSTFSGITFEDITLMLTMADNSKRNNKDEVISDVEKISLNLI
jgi:hypothetical protein